MSVLAFSNCQQKVVDLIEARAFFATETVVLHQGKTLSEVEEALRDAGQVTVVYPIQAAGGAKNGLGAAIMSATLDVLFAFNPEKGTLDIYEMVTEGIGAVLEYFNPNTPQDRFEVEDLSIAEADDGVWGYLVTFRKSVQFT